MEYKLLKAEWDGYSDGLCRTCDPHAPGPSHHLSISKKSAATAFREPLQFIVIAVMSVMSGTFPDTNTTNYVTINYWSVRRPSCHRHSRINPRLNGFLATLTVMTLMTLIYGLILFMGAHLYFLGSLTPSTYPTNPTRRTRSPNLCRSSVQLLSSGFSNLPENPSLLPDEKDGPSSVYREVVKSTTRTRQHQTPYLCRILQLSSGSSGFVETWEPPTRSEGVHAAQEVFRHHALCCSTSCGKGGPVPLRSFVSGFISLRIPDEPDDI